MLLKKQQVCIVLLRFMSRRGYSVCFVAPFKEL